MTSAHPRSAPIARYVIVNADDFGLTQGVNRGIIQTFEQGIVTSTSLMVRAEAAEDAAEYARAHPSLAVGLHLYFGEWVYQDGEWVQRDRVGALDDESAVRSEVGHQLVLFHRLMGRPPTHLDAHQHAQREEPARSIVAAQAASLGVPVRLIQPEVRYVGDFYGQTGEGKPLPELLSVEHLIAMLDDLEPGITEFGCHPGFAEGLDSSYRWEREREVEVLCDPRVRAEIEALEIRLISFAELP